MLQTPIKPYSGSSETRPKKVPRKPDLSEGVGSDEEEEGSPTCSPHQHSSSDGGSDLEDLLTKDFPQDDLPSLMTRAMGKGEGGRDSGVWCGCGNRDSKVGVSRGQGCGRGQGSGVW